MLRADWAVRGDWGGTVEGFLSVTDLGRLRRVNKAWRAGVDGNTSACESLGRVVTRRSVAIPIAAR